MVKVQARWFRPLIVRGRAFDRVSIVCKIEGCSSCIAPARDAMIRKSHAEVAELADAHGSGPCTRKGVGVRVPSSAPVIEVLRCAQDFACRLPLRSRPQTGSSSHKATRFSCRDAAERGASPSSLRPTALCGRVQRAERVPVGFLSDVPASAGQRLLRRHHGCLGGGTVRSKHVSRRSQNGDAKPSLEEPQGDPLLQHNASGSFAGAMVWKSPGLGNSAPCAQVPLD
jgi:hypothetical protein